MYKYENLSTSDVAILIHAAKYIDTFDPMFYAQFILDCDPEENVIKIIEDYEALTELPPVYHGIEFDNFEKNAVIITRIYVGVMQFYSGLFEFVSISNETIRNNPRISPFIKSEDVFADFIKTLDLDDPDVNEIGD